MRIFVLAALAVMFVPGVSAAAGRCEAITESAERTRCFFEAFQTTEEHRSEWRLGSTVSDMTDQLNVYVAVESKERVNCPWNKDRLPAELAIQCREGETSLHLTTDCHMASGHGGYGDVTYRIGSRQAKVRAFEASNNNRALELKDFRRAEPLIKGIFGEDRLLMRFTPYAQSPIQVSFNVTGLEAAIAPLREACGW